MRVCRTRPWPARTSSSGGTDLLTDVGIVGADGTTVAAGPFLPEGVPWVRTLELRDVLWLPGMCRSAEHAWNQRGNLLPPGDGGTGSPTPTRERVTPGAYRALGIWETAVWDDVPQPLDPVASRPFTLTP